MDVKTVSTSKASWQKDCETFRRAGVPFKVTGVRGKEHQDFVLGFAAKHQLTIAQGNGVAYFAAGPQGV
jgi:hypothetical protein